MTINKDYLTFEITKIELKAIHDSAWHWLQRLKLNQKEMYMRLCSEEENSYIDGQIKTYEVLLSKIEAVITESQENSTGE